MAKKYHAVKIKTEVNLIVSDAMLKRLENGEVTEILRGNAFKNNDRSFKNDKTTFEPIKTDIEDWNEAWDLIIETK